ncbi:PC-esterase domain-containing protein 1A isoform X2 [Poecilia reticulata]|uniref:PC-esterase domain-containing protein 1A isoform X2 n=1 Tax=Poecilia reticulata TaxID=8081 RepID=UPI0004A24DDA|nr:PREDICTED: PC-esterase domain-containing protein 1A-like isoform X2 [Poecilia reticulata]
MKSQKETASHQQARLLLHNKFVVVLGDSIQRSVYKDLVVLLQKDRYLTLRQLKSKGEMSFELDCLVEGGCLNRMNNGTEYTEVRQYQSDHHLIRFYFVTRIFSRYMQSIIEDFRHGLKPDVVIVNSCVWDISRYNPKWVDDYKANLKRFFGELKSFLPEETLIIWNLTMPLGERIKGGFLVPEIEHKAPQLRYDVIEANFYGGTLADNYDVDVLDLHFQFRFSLQHRTKDGVHWNAIAHRRITALLLRHIAQAWGVMLTADVPEQKSIYDCSTKFAAAVNSDSFREEFTSDSLSGAFLSFEDKRAPMPHRHENAENFQPAVQPQQTRPRRRPQQKHYVPPRHGVDNVPPSSSYFEPYEDYHQPLNHQFVMRNRHSRPHYAPYTHHKPDHRPFHGY